jgi:acetolactate synthase-1/2/3 large subunit
MFDQAGMLREAVKWDYELRVPSQVGDVVSRAFEVSMTSPRGPVYLVLPREPLAAPLAELPEPIIPRSLPALPHADPKSIATLAEWISKAERPLLIVSAIENDAVEPLARLAERHALPVVTQRSRTMCMSSNHPMHFGFDPAGMIEDADLIVVIESDVPWILDTQPPAAGCRVAHIGEDPVFQRYPMRSFPSDLSVTAHAAHAIEALDEALGKLKQDAKKTEQRRERLAERSRKRREQNAKASTSTGEQISPAYLSRLLGETVGPDAIIFNEYSMMQEHCSREKPGTYYGLSPAGGLGWGFGAALGAKLAAPEKLVVAALGDGAYVFSNPLVGHWVSQAQDLPIMIVLFNNSRYGAVRNSTLSMFKDGAAGQDDGRFMADLAPMPPFEAMVQAQGGHGERVDNAADLPAALARARDVVLKEKRQALVNVMTPY